MRPPKEIWKSKPLYVSVYNILKTLTMIQGNKEIYFSLKEIYEAIKADSAYKDVEISLKDLIKAIMILELNGLVKTVSNGEDVWRLSVALMTSQG